ncbi:sulfotransferase family 2 domain-containing protein [Desulfosarcina ovata]|uniref:Sulfotransferase family protein n=1 Tax=Desulfosarcina ovata subsp. ovata TaxID=2752305 RepID=A0A5K8A755_9BACT|nr:sulfotransferase family 2 domain-containing protein [Desulfosarcina ovata]BBO88347.1 hypothetical protein DSCOOX_15270 [Desulfosarcina ovata subsp. ovata]
MICHHYKCIFIHVPKNAGQSVEHIFINLLGLKWKTRAPLLLRYNDMPELGPPRLAHLMADEYVRFKYLTQEMFDDYFKFAFVRNPWSRVVSFYNYLGYNKICDFKTFLMKDFKNKIFKEKYWFVRPQNEFLFSSDGRCLVNFIGKFENIQEGFNYVCEQIKIPKTQLLHINTSSNNTDCFDGKKDNGKKLKLVRYQSYYDKESFEFVFSIYKKDINIFNYNFLN